MRDQLKKVDLTNKNEVAQEDVDPEKVEEDQPEKYAQEIVNKDQQQIDIESGEESNKDYKIDK